MKLLECLELSKFVWPIEAYLLQVACRAVLMRGKYTPLCTYPELRGETDGRVFLQDRVTNIILKTLH
jgi:hypothetical protein